MIRFGVSLYPEQEKTEEIREYLKTVSEYGFTKVFTSLFSIEGSKEEIFSYCSDLCTCAHGFGLFVTGDVSADFLSRMDISPDDLSPVREMGLDCLRMDVPFFDERMIRMINNPYGIQIEMNAMMVPVIRGLLSHTDLKKDQLSVSHNFYPQRYTGMDTAVYRERNAFYKEHNIPTAAYISSNAADTHGPWPLSDGLPTLEDHRNLEIGAQVRHLIALGNIDSILIGNAFADTQELSRIKEIIDYISHPWQADPEDPMAALKQPRKNARRIPLAVDFTDELSDIEKKILFDFHNHHDAGDGTSYMLRSRSTRTLYKGNSIPKRNCERKEFQRGDVLIVNDIMMPYTGEVQIVLKPIMNDGTRNYAGTVRSCDMPVLDELHSFDVFDFIRQDRAVKG